MPSPNVPGKAERVWLVIALVMAATCVAQAFGRFTWVFVLSAAVSVLGALAASQLPD